MGKKATFIVSGWIERHYRLEIEASSYDEAESKGYDKLYHSEPSDLYAYEDGTHVIMGDVECEDSEWEEGDDDSSEEKSEEEKEDEL